VSTQVSSVYVHAPFCARRCNYCDFAVQVRKEGDLEGWRDAIAGELRAVQEEGLFALAPSLATLYVGGGTPSLLGAGAMSALAALLGPERLRAPHLEWTAEANPESLTTEVAEQWRRAGVNRLSLGAQTFHGPTLSWMGRMHGPDGPARAIGIARESGLTNLSVDLMFGLPRRLERDWTADLEGVLALDVPHVSLYGLTVESGTPLARAVVAGKEIPVDDEMYRDEYLLAVEMLGAAGYEHYEVSNFARPGFASRHNTAYWDGSAYLGLGNGSHSYADPVRRWNLADWDDYRTTVAAGLLPEAEREEIGPTERGLERVWLGLRTGEGLPVEDLNHEQRQRVARWVTEGWTASVEPRVRLNAQGWLLLDRLAVDLDSGAVG
jgi:oxygen-independent coproporphyrinogen III oxidase